jgi:hypothetical protein
LAIFAVRQRSPFRLSRAEMKARNVGRTGKQRRKICRAGSLRTEIEPNPLVNELQRISVLVVGALVDHSNRQHFFEKILPAHVGHSANSERERIAGVDDAVLFQLLDRKRDLIIFDVRIILLDARVCLGIVAVEIVVPADRGGVQILPFVQAHVPDAT